MEAISNAACTNSMANIQSCEMGQTLISLNIGTSFIKYGNRLLIIKKIIIIIKTNKEGQTIKLQN
jgi:hypothetical protein